MTLGRRQEARPFKRARWVVLASIPVFLSILIADTAWKTVPYRPTPLWFHNLSQISMGLFMILGMLAGPIEFGRKLNDKLLETEFPLLPFSSVFLIFEYHQHYKIDIRPLIEAFAEAGPPPDPKQSLKLAIKRAKQKRKKRGCQNSKQGEEER